MLRIRSENGMLICVQKERVKNDFSFFHMLFFSSLILDSMMLGSKSILPPNDTRIASHFMLSQS